ncbi:MAG: ABC transporter ATP-binding protein, partial [Actinomycetes bacterium]
LVLDEPTFGQDRRTWLELIDLLAGLRDAGSGLCLATHDEAFVAALADEIAVLDQGRIGQRPTGGAGASASTGAADLGRPDRPGR